MHQIYKLQINDKRNKGTIWVSEAAYYTHEQEDSEWWRQLQNSPLIKIKDSTV